MAGEQRAGARAQRGPSAGPRGTVGARCAFATSDAWGTCQGAAGGVTGARRVWQGSRTWGAPTKGQVRGQERRASEEPWGRGPEPRAELQKGGAAARRLLSTRARVHPCAVRASTCACVPVHPCAGSRVPCAVLVSPGVCARGRVCVRVGATGPGGSRGGTWGPRLKKALRGGESSQVRSGSPAQPSESGPRDRAGVNQAGFPRGPHPCRLPARAPGPWWLLPMATGLHGSPRGARGGQGWGLSWPRHLLPPLRARRAPSVGLDGHLADCPAGPAINEGGGKDPRGRLR